MIPLCVHRRKGSSIDHLVILIGDWGHTLQGPPKMPQVGISELGEGS